MIAQDSDAYIDGDYVRYKMNAPKIETPFALDNVTGQVYMNESMTTPDVEQFKMTGCVYDRRLDETCSDLTITFYTCFEPPTCDGQSKIITSETYTVGDVLFEVSYSDQGGTLDPNSIRTFAIESSTLETIQFENQSGIVVLTKNLTVWPNYPFVQHTIVVRINNSESCNSSTCTMSLKVYNSTFKNFDIRITNMDGASVEVYDNTTDSILLFAIETTDDNGPEYDSVTCSIIEGESTPPNNYKFAVVAVNVSEYAIFTAENPSFDYNITEKYRLAVECKDEHGSSDHANLTVNILFNGTTTTTFTSSISSCASVLPSSSTIGVSTAFTSVVPTATLVNSNLSSSTSTNAIELSSSETLGITSTEISSGASVLSSSTTSEVSTAFISVVPSATLVNSTLPSSASTNAIELSSTETSGITSIEASSGASVLSSSTTSGVSTSFTSVVPTATLVNSDLPSSTSTNAIELSSTETLGITSTEASSGASVLSSFTTSGMSTAFTSVVPSTTLVNSNLPSSASTNTIELSFTETIGITSTEANADGKSSSSKGGMIAGIVVGVLAVVGAVTAAAGILLHKKNMIGPSNNDVMELEPGWQGKETAPEPRNQKFKMKPNNIVHPETSSSSC